VFEVGKEYRIDTLDDLGEDGTVTTHHHCVIIEVRLPLVKVNQSEETWIINTASPVFVGAKLQN
jgi:hypothetical protein